MGKKRITNISSKKEKDDHKIVTGKDHGKVTDMGEQALAEAEIIKKKEAKLEKELIKETEKEVKKQTKKTKKSSPKYIKAKQKVDSNKLYPLKEALNLLKEVSLSKFTGSVEIHLVVKESGQKGEVEFPYSTGKKQIIKIVDDNLIGELEKGKISFTTLVATPQSMAKLVKFAKLLGPKGLMPNPKNGTISDQPEKAAEIMAKKTTFKTENKAPLMHLTIGKVDMPEKEIEANFKSLIKAVGRKNIKKVAIAPTMGPSIKIDLSS